MSELNTSDPSVHQEGWEPSCDFFATPCDTCNLRAERDRLMVAIDSIFGCTKKDDPTEAVEEIEVIILKVTTEHRILVCCSVCHKTHSVLPTEEPCAPDAWVIQGSELPYSPPNSTEPGDTNAQAD